MKIIPLSDSALSEVTRILRAGGVVAHPTETCYGFACDLSNPAAVEKLFLVKDRPRAQPVSALFSSVDEAKKFVQWNDRAEELAKEFLPGPLTLVLPMRRDVPFAISPVPSSRFQVPRTRNQEPRTLGLRISSHPFAQAVASAFGKPISTTSANIHGKTNPYSVAEILGQFEGRTYQPDLVIDGGILPKNSPSKVIDLASKDERQLR